MKEMFRSKQEEIENGTAEKGDVMGSLVRAADTTDRYDKGDLRLTEQEVIGNTFVSSPLLNSCAVLELKVSDLDSGWTRNYSQHTPLYLHDVSIAS